MTTAATAAPTTKQLATAAAAQAAARWQQVDPAAVTSGWAAQLPAVVAGVITAQIAAASAAQSYLLAQGVTTRLIATAFGGTASDGLPLVGLLFQPALTTLFALRRGASARMARAAGAATLDMIVRTQVADASRAATSAGIAADQGIYGYERVVHLPACGRCIILAGRAYRWSQGFSRHPRCDCTMHPVTREQHRTLNLDHHPRALFDRMTPEQQAKAFTAAGARAIRDGADLPQVVNARSGMSTAVIGGQKLLTTTSGATRRGAAGKRLGGSAVRLMPEAIYKIAADRDDAIRLLRLHGFIL